MKAIYLILLGTASVSAASVVQAQSQDQTAGASDGHGVSSATPASQETKTFSTGVAKGRDLLDTAISASTLDQNEIRAISPRSLGEIFRAIPGVRSEIGQGEGNAGIAIRGLQMASTGAKFLQLQEDGLPVLEFGDMAFGGADLFMRADINLARIEAIRGGSASTFASNSPGGVINLISQTGEVEGGSVIATAGIDYDESRLDFDYGGKLSDTLRFHFGGFYRKGEGPRRTGYDAYNGGQFKMNLTRDFSGGYVRVYTKFLDDRTPAYLQNAIRVSGSASNPDYANVGGISFNGDTPLSRYHSTNVTLDENNNVVSDNLHDGQHSIVKSFGFEAQFGVSDWTITNRFRFSDISGQNMIVAPAGLGSGADVATMIGGAGATLTYASGPNSGQAIALSGPDGGGLMASVLVGDFKINSFDNVTNELRASRVWDAGAGKLTTTIGFYKSRQSYDTRSSYNTVLMNLRPNGESVLVDVTDNNGVRLSQDGYLNYNAGTAFPIPPTSTRVHYDTNAAFGSLNYQQGKISLGASLRYDFGSAKGAVYSASLGGGRVGNAPRDMNGDGTIQPIEQSVGVIPLTRPGAVDYSFDYLSYSLSANYRMSGSFALFGRYSKGARANSTRFLFTSFIDSVSGRLTDPDALVDFVRQAEIGLKYRNAGLMLNLTGFWAKSDEHNQFFGPVLARKYRAFGAEFEGSYSYGPFGVMVGATYTDSKIVADSFNAAVIGNVPASQPKLLVQVTPRLDTRKLSIGTHVFGVTDRYAFDTNQLKIPGFVTVNPFLSYRPVDRLELSVNANNIFDVTGLNAVFVPADGIPANNLATAQGINGRTISASVRFDF